MLIFHPVFSEALLSYLLLPVLSSCERRSTVHIGWMAKERGRSTHGRRVARSTSPNIAHYLESHIAQLRTLLHKLRKKYRPKPEFWAFNAFLLANFIAQKFKISPKFPIWVMKSPIWPPCMCADFFQGGDGKECIKSCTVPQKWL